MKGTSAYQPWNSIPNVLRMSDEQLGDLRKAERIRRTVYSSSAITDEQSAAALRVLIANDATDLAPMLGLA